MKGISDTGFRKHEYLLALLLLLFIISNSGLSKLSYSAFNKMELRQPQSLQFPCNKTLVWPPVVSHLPEVNEFVIFSVEFKWEKYLSRSKGRSSHQLWGWQLLCSGTWCLPRATTHCDQSSTPQHGSGCHTAGKGTCHLNMWAVIWFQTS